ncbi:MAG: TetR family transcriptional regulator [Bacteroidaceae bacterium]|nr:TetR family transcriptional regulator [Bacteroidaceae bacterium]
MAISKTRAILVDVARQLFAKNGIEETTMNDIAVASQKGRRTLYTYFKNKEEIYYAVVESELEHMSERMFAVAEMDISPEDKIIELIYARLDAVKEIVYRNGTLKAEFFRDIWGVEKARKEFDKNQIELFRRVLNQGKFNDIFDVDNTDLIATVLHYCLKGIEVPYVRGILTRGLAESDTKPYVTKLVFKALGKNLNLSKINNIK